MSTFAPVKTTLIALLAAAAAFSAHAQPPAKKGAKDTGQQIADGMELEMTAMMAGMIDTCKVSFPALSSKLDTAWNEGIKTAPPKVIAYTKSAEFKTKRQQYHKDQLAQAAEPGQLQELEKGCDSLLEAS